MCCRGGKQLHNLFHLPEMWPSRGNQRFLQTEANITWCAS